MLRYYMNRYLKGLLNAVLLNLDTSRLDIRIEYDSNKYNVKIDPRRGAYAVDEIAKVIELAADFIDKQKKEIGFTGNDKGILSKMGRTVGLQHSEVEELERGTADGLKALFLRFSERIRRTDDKCFTKIYWGRNKVSRLSILNLEYHEAARAPFLISKDTGRTKNLKVYDDYSPREFTVYESILLLAGYVFSRVGVFKLGGRKTVQTVSIHVLPVVEGQVKKSSGVFSLYVQTLSEKLVSRENSKKSSKSVPVIESEPALHLMLLSNATQDFDDMIIYGITKGGNRPPSILFTYTYARRELPLEAVQRVRNEIIELAEIALGVKKRIKASVRDLAQRYCEEIYYVITQGGTGIQEFYYTVLNDRMKYLENKDLLPVVNKACKVASSLYQFYK